MLSSVAMKGHKAGGDAQRRGARGGRKQHKQRSYRVSGKDFDGSWSSHELQPRQTLQQHRTSWGSNAWQSDWEQDSWAMVQPGSVEESAGARGSPDSERPVSVIEVDEEDFAGASRAVH